MDLCCSSLCFSFSFDWLQVEYFYVISIYLIIPSKSITPSSLALICKFENLS